MYPACLHFMASCARRSSPCRPWPEPAAGAQHRQLCRRVRRGPKRHRGAGVRGRQSHAEVLLRLRRGRARQSKLTQKDVDMLTKMHNEEISDADVEAYPTLEDLLNANEGYEDSCRKSLGLPADEGTDVEEAPMEEDTVPDDGGGPACRGRRLAAGMIGQPHRRIAASREADRCVARRVTASDPANQTELPAWTLDVAASRQSPRRDKIPLFRVTALHRGLRFALKIRGKHIRMRHGKKTRAGTPAAEPRQGGPLS